MLKICRNRLKKNLSQLLRLTSIHIFDYNHWLSSKKLPQLDRHREHFGAPSEQVRSRSNPSNNRVPINRLHILICVPEIDV